METKMRAVSAVSAINKRDKETFVVEVPAPEQN
jgi:hypothetical protein